MLIDLMDRCAGRLSRRWLVGRRFVIDFRESNERRVAVIELPEGDFSFDLRKNGEVTELALNTGKGVKVLATFNEDETAEQAAKRVRLAMVRPFRRVVLACVGILIVMVTFDVALTPRAARMASAPPLSRAGAGSGLSQEQINGMILRDRSAGAPIPNPASAVAPPAAAAEQAQAEAASSPQAQVAIQLLKGGK